jgi:hypothetical protein
MVEFQRTDIEADGDPQTAVTASVLKKLVYED